MKVVRFILIIVLAAAFGAIGFHLYQKQKNKFSYASFRVENSANTVLFSNLDRLLNNLRSIHSLDVQWLNSKLESGVQMLVQSNQPISQIVGNSCYLSENSEQFNLAFNHFVELDEVQDFLTNELDLNVSFTADEITINESTYRYQRFNDFTVFSSGEIKAVPNQEEIERTNVDYLVIKDSMVENHLFTKDQAFKIWTTNEEPVRGQPIRHRRFLEKIPVSFESLSLYGSSRFQEDQLTYFGELPTESMDWVSEGIAVLKKGSFEILIGKQNDNRDLKLMLEEQTIAHQSDSGRVQTFNIKNFEIMAFHSDFKWNQAIPELDQELRFYTELEEFNVLANSIEAMRWYLAEIQIENLFLNASELEQQYQKSLPLNVHKLRIESNGETEGLVFSSETWRSKTKSTKTLSNFSAVQAKADRIENLTFMADFVPSYIQLVEKDQTVLLAGEGKVALYNSEGQQTWFYTSSSQLKQPIQLVDLDNNGKWEYVVFNQKGLVVLNENGQPMDRLTLQNAQNFSQGICMNYDNKFDYRFLLINGKNIDYYSEKGEIVEGWQFKESQEFIQTALHYTQIQGRDYISFKDASNHQYILNRRGENRFPVTRQFELPNEANFLTGSNESEMHKTGYGNQYIYSYFVRDGYLDSVQLDKRINPLNVRWIEEKGSLLLIVEEASRIMIFNPFGYLETEILKPEGVGEFLGVHKFKTFNYVFFNNSQNSLYLLDNTGKLRLRTNKTNQLYGISQSRLCTFDGKQINVHTLN